MLTTKKETFDESKGCICNKKYDKELNQAFFGLLFRNFAAKKHYDKRFNYEKTSSSGRKKSQKYIKANH